MNRAGSAVPTAVAIGAIYSVVAIIAFAVAPQLGLEYWPLKHDQVGYYAYLPALMHDAGLSFEWASGPLWDGFQRGGFGGFHLVETTGHRINKYAPGVALLQAPFFAVGHLLAAAVGAVRDGFSWPYRLLVTLGGVAYATLGLGFLARALGSHFSRRVVIAAVVILGLGTNLLYYATFEPLMSHAYSFFALSVALWGTLAWGERPLLRHALVTGAAIGLAFTIRPTNLLFAVVPLGYALTCRSREGLGLTVRHLAAAAAVALVAASPLFVYWHFASGSWFANPYVGEGFYFADPEIRRLLWSYRKGWFVYTPAMLALLPGLMLVRRHISGLALPLLLYFGGAVYLAASWWSWWYGGSMGMRAMIEVSAPMSVALAAFLAWGARGVARRRMTAAAFGLLVALNVFQTYQYVRTYIRWDGMSSSSYWAVFLRPSIPERELEEIYRRINTEGQRSPLSAER